MAEMNITIDVYLKESDGRYYAEGKLDSLKPLADSAISTFEDRLEIALSKLKREDGGAKMYRLEALAKIYGDYLLADRIETIDSFSHRFEFTCGSGGVEFARDFAFMLYTFDVSKVVARVSDIVTIELDSDIIRYK
jgi:hypothetical protein